jgi:hypothetical protein
MTDLSTLESLARAATPGPWSVRSVQVDQPVGEWDGMRHDILFDNSETLDDPRLGETGWGSRRRLHRRGKPSRNPGARVPREAARGGAEGGVRLPRRLSGRLRIQPRPHRQASQANRGHMSERIRSVTVRIEVDTNKRTLDVILVQAEDELDSEFIERIGFELKQAKESVL